MTTIAQAKREAYDAAIKALTGYKFMMFGYRAAIWIYLNQIDPDKEPNPFKDFVSLARTIQSKNNGQTELNFIPNPRRWAGGGLMPTPISQKMAKHPHKKACLRSPRSPGPGSEGSNG